MNKYSELHCFSLLSLLLITPPLAYENSCPGDRHVILETSVDKEEDFGMIGMTGPGFHLLFVFGLAQLAELVPSLYTFASSGAAAVKSPP